MRDFIHGEYVAVFLWSKKKSNLCPHVSTQSTSDRERDSRQNNRRLDCLSSVGPMWH